MEVDVLVIGAGISGLATAWALARRGLEVQVWERGANPGGKIRSTRAGGYLMERAATLVAGPGRDAGALVDALGLTGSRLDRPARVPRHVMHERRLVTLGPELRRVLFAPLWSTRGRLRMALEPFVGRGSGEETVEGFVSRRFGREALERVFEPYVAGPLGSDVHLASAGAVLPQLVGLERRYGSIAIGLLIRYLARAGRPAFEAFSFQGGMSTLIGGLAHAPGVTVTTELEAAGLEPLGGGWRARGRGRSGTRELRARQVVLAVPAPAAARLVAPLDGVLASLLGGVHYAAISVVHLGFEVDRIGHDLNGMGFLTTRCSGTDINGCLWSSSLFPGRAPPGKALLTVYLGGARNPGVVSWSEGECVERAVSDVGPALGLRGAPDFVRVVRHRRALPLYHGRYTSRLSALAERLRQMPGLHLEANYRGGVAVRNRLLRGELLGARVAAALEGGGECSTRSRRRPWHRAPPAGTSA